MRTLRPPLIAIAAAALLAPAAAVGGLEAVSSNEGDDGTQSLAARALAGLGERREASQPRVGLGVRRARAKQRDVHAVGYGDRDPTGLVAGTDPVAPADGPVAVPEPAPPVPAPPTPEPAPTPAPGADPEPPPSDLSPAEEAEPDPQPEPPAVGAGTPLAPSGLDLVIGIDGGYASWSARETGYRTQLGASFTRHEWDPAAPVDEQDDVVVEAAGVIHTRIHALLGGNRLGDPAHYSDWVVSFVRRYGVGGSFWSEHPGLDASRYAVRTIELGNEPYFGAMPADEYADTVRPLLERIDDLNLPVKVVLPAWVYGQDVSWVETLYDRVPGLNSLYDALAFHPYWYGHAPSEPGDSGPIARIVTLRDRMDALGAASKQIYLTEYGESTASCGGECVSEEEQAAHLAEMIGAIVSHPGWGVGMLSVFQLLDRGTGSADRELQFGLLREDGSPKPSYAIVRAALQLHR